MQRRERVLRGPGSVPAAGSGRGAGGPYAPRPARRALLRALLLVAALALLAGGVVLARRSGWGAWLGAGAGAPPGLAPPPARPAPAAGVVTVASTRVAPVETASPPPPPPPSPAAASPPPPSPLPPSPSPPSPPPGCRTCAIATALEFNAPAVELFRRIDAQPNRGLFVTFGSLGMQEFIVNWVTQVERQGLGPYVVGALDEGAVKLCAEQGIPAVGFGNLTMNTTGAYWRQNERVFLNMANLKAELLVGMLSSGWDCMMSDVDVLWFESPWPWLGGVGVTVFPEAARMAHADVLISTDIVEVEAYSVHAQWLQNREYNTGIVFFRATNASIALVRLWRQRVQIEGAIKGLYINDQAVFNRMTHGSHGPLLDYPPGTPPPDLDPESVVGVYVVSSPIMAPEGVTVSLGVLPFTRFCSGHVFFINRLPQRFGHRAAAVHATYQYADEKVYSYGKRHRLRQAQGWHIDPPDYFEAGSFLVIAGDSLLADANYTQAQLAVWRGKEHRGTDRRSDNGIALHFRMERVQRRRLRDAFALAIALNRTLVLPEMTCFCDRYWWLVHACRMPGAESMPLPIACPLDHLHDIGRFYDQQLQFREAGFLSNPRVPAALAASRARLVVGRGAPPRAPGYDDGQPASAELLVEDGLTLEGAAAAVGAHPAGAARVLEVALRDLGAFCGFADPARGSAVDARLRAAFSLEFNVCGEEDNVLPLVNWDPVAMPLNCTRGYLGLYPDSIAATAEALPACAAAAAAAAAGADGRAPRR